MASLSEDPGKRGKTYRIGVLNADRQRKTIRIGAMPKKKAETIRSHVDQLEACQFDGSAPPPATAAWVASLGDVLRKRLEKAGLVQAARAEKPQMTIGELVAAYKDRPRWLSLKPNTRRNVENGLAHLLDYFPEKTPIDEIDEADAEDYRDKLMLSKEDDGAGLVVSSANNVASIGHRLYKLAISKRWIAVSPFAALPKGGTRGNNVDVSLATSLAVLAQLTDTQERLLFGLSRWGGLRCPSEPALLKWGDIDWSRKRFTVTAPKTERHPGHERRVVPIFPELMPLFEARFNEAAEGEVLVLPFMRGKDGANFRQLIKRATRNAGLEPWPRTFHSMRATRETELAAKHPLHIASAWIGNSTVVAMKHYLSVSEHDFEAAQKAAQKAAQTVTVDVSHDASAAPLAG